MKVSKSLLIISLPTLIFASSFFLSAPTVFAQKTVNIKSTKETVKAGKIISITVHKTASPNTAKSLTLQAQAATISTPNPPFTECPAIGNDTSCGILIQITDTSNIILSDPSQGPFDGADDTLIGVLNSSSQSISSIQLSSNTDIFGFDGDGICSGDYVGTPVGCPFGPTGYEGPGISYSNINQNQTGGTVNFTPALAPGKTSYFSLEEPITQSTIVSGGPSSSEQGGSSNPSENPTNCSTSSPVNCATGEFWHQFTDFNIPGRGVALNFTHTYLSASASADGPLGFGWTHSYNLSLSTDSTGDVTVTQEDGSTVTFTPTGGGSLTAAPWVQATLTQNPDGTFDFYRESDRVHFAFSASGQLQSETDLNGYVTKLAYSGNNLTTIADPEGRALTISYTGSHISKITDPLGRSMTFTYDSSGNLASQTDNLGRTSSFTYDTNHLLLTMTNPNSGKITNVYDSSNRVISQTDPTGAKTMWSYSGDPASSAGGTTTMADPNGNVTVYNVSNLELTSVTHASGTSLAATTSYTYDPATLGITSVTDPNGHVTTNTYDSAGDLLSTTNPLGNTTTYSYNSLKEVLSKTTPLSEQTSYSYDSNGNLTSTTDPLGHITTYIYGDSSHPGDITSITDPNSHVKTITYDTYGNIASFTVSPSSGVTDTTAYVSDMDSELVCSTSPNATVSGVKCPSPGGSYVADTTAKTYDGDGEVTGITDPNGHTTSYTYDGYGNKIQMTDANGNVTKYSFDADNRQTKQTAADGTVQSETFDSDGNGINQTNGAGNTTKYTYDALNRVISSTDPLNRTTTYGYNLTGNRTSLTDPSSNVTTFGYDAANELIAITYSDGKTPNVSYSYNTDGNKTSMSDGTGTTSYTYDAEERLTSVSNGAGSKVSYTYDPAGQLTSLTYPNGQNVTRTYDGAGRLTSVSDWLGNTTNFTDDANSNVTSIAYPNGVKTTSTFDNTDTPTTISDAKGSTGLASFSYTRDNLGQVTSTTTTGISDGPETYSYTQLNQLGSLNGSVYNYDHANNITQLASGAMQTFDAASELTSTTQPPSTPTLDQQVSTDSKSLFSNQLTTPTFSIKNGKELIIAYVTLDTQWPLNVGGVSVSGGGLTWSRAAQGDTHAGTVEIWQAYSNAPLTNTTVTATLKNWPFFHGSLTVSTFTGAGTKVGATATSEENSKSLPSVTLTTTKANSIVWADALDHDHATIVPDSGQTLDHQYIDKSDNETFWVQNTGSISKLGSKVSIGDSSPKTNPWDLLAIEIVPSQTSSSATTSASFTYDTRGNRITETPTGGTTVNLAYDQANRLISYGTNATYNYDGNGLRMSKTVSSITTAFAWDESANVPLLFADGANYYIYGVNGQAIEKISGTTVNYLHQDQQGSTRLITDANGNVVGTYSYDPYGDVTSHTGTVSTPLQYDGQYADAESGYIYLRARYYDPATGQFLNVDPIVNETGIPYLYADDNPINDIDPRGLFAVASCVLGTGTAVYGAGISINAETCYWVGTNWTATTISAGGSISVGAGGGVDIAEGTIYSLASSPQELVGRSCSVGGSVKAIVGVTGNLGGGCLWGLIPIPNSVELDLSAGLDAQATGSYGQSLSCVLTSSRNFSNCSSFGIFPSNSSSSSSGPGCSTSEDFEDLGASDNNYG